MSDSLIEWIEALRDYERYDDDLIITAVNCGDLADLLDELVEYRKKERRGE